MFGVSSYSGFYGNMKCEANRGSYIAVLNTSTVNCQLSRDIPADAACLSDIAMGRDARNIARATTLIRNLETKIEQPLFQFHAILRNRSCALWEEQDRISTNLMP
jgi:hypothetical protein